VAIQEAQQPTSPEASAPAAPRRSRLGVLVRRFGPWLMAAVILGWIFDRVPVAGAIEALKTASLGSFAVGSSVAVLYWFLIESRSFAFLFSRFNTPVSWAEARSLRGLTYMLTPINWNLGTAAIVLHLRRTKQVAALDLASSLLLYGAADGIVVPGLLLVGSLALPAGTLLGDARGFAALFLLSQLLLIILVMNDEPRWSWLERLRGVRVFQAYRKARFSDVAILLAARSVYMAGHVLLFWWGTAAFGIDLPLAFATASMPLVLLSAALPITPGGLGTQQAAMLFLYAPYGEEAAILGFALAYPVALIVLRLAIGLRYLPDLRAFRAAGETALPEEAPAEAGA
jgi:uncharacterized membrane protein YbhN (UPF0104 family)